MCSVGTRSVNDVKSTPPGVWHVICVDNTGYPSIPYGLHLKRIKLVCLNVCLFKSAKYIALVLSCREEPENGT